MRVFVISIFIVLIAMAGKAQNKVEGKVFELHTRVGIPGAKIENLKTRIISLADSSGRFSILAKPDDLLAISNFTYKIDTILLHDLNYLEIYLQPKQNQLKEVVVKNNSISDNKWTSPEFHGQKLVYQKEMMMVI